MNDHIYEIIILILTISYAVWRFIQRRWKIAKENGIEETAKEIEKLKRRKLKEQFRIVTERSDILYAEFLAVFAKNMEVDTESTPAKLYNDCILNYVRIETDKIMKDAIYVNNIAKREGYAWDNYKKGKFEYILTEMIKFIGNIWREDIIGYSHEEVVSKCRKDIVVVYQEHILGMFEEIKNIAIIYDDEIEKYIKILKDIKLGKKRKK